MFTGMMMAGRPRINKNITISVNTENYNLISDDFGGVAPTAPTTVIITIESAVEVYSDTTTLPGMDLTGLPTGSTIALTNLGSIFGMGGSGGVGGIVNTEEEGGDCDAFVTSPTTGSAASHALLCDGNVDLTITNAAGEIFGGGGGGGGGAACERQTPPCQSGGGGGGGGGAGGQATGGTGGAGGSSTHFTIPVCTATNGNTGTGGSSGAGGTGGAGCGGSCTGLAGGAGGAWGANGTASGGGAGAGGNSVRHTGAGTVSYATGGSQGNDIKGSTD